MTPIIAIEGEYSDRVRVKGGVDLSFNSFHATVGIDGGTNPEALDQIEALIANWKRDADGDASLVVTADQEGGVLVNGVDAKSYDYAVKRGVYLAQAVTITDTSSST